jgi:beta-lactam-binding protein with PASTA domain
MGGVVMQLGESLRRRRTSSAGRPGLPRWGPGARLALATVALAFVGALAGYLFATRALFPAPAPPSDLRTVPDLTGLSSEEARVRIAESDLLSGDVDFVHHPRVDSGRIIAQAPLPDQLAQPEGRVSVTVSLGPERSLVPEVVGLRREWAVNVLEATGFVVQADSTESREPRGVVVEVEPEAGSDLPIPGDVRITVSTGPAMVSMPAVVGLTQEEAADTLRALGLALEEVEEVFRFGRDQGVVVQQTPPADSVVEVGSAVGLGVGRR